jgi:lipopolysaccharide transport system ATP-binding protein
MPSLSLSVECVSKLFRSGTAARYLRLSEALQRAVQSAWDGVRRARRESPAESETHTFWALREVSFDVHDGEVLAIIGPNGAGKSTLLKIISKISRPTSGRVGVRGRVGSLLEVGTGFHPELTGRENVFLNGAILGMSRRDVRRRFDEIVSFAGVEQHLELPVKWYSSGMYVRLAFAVAAHLEPEVLLVDEILAVGDLAFQRKCLGKISDVARSGRTVLYVSHNMTAVTGLCSRVVLLESGRLTADGRPSDVVNQYMRSVASPAQLRSWTSPDAPGDEQARLRGVRLAPESPETVDHLDVQTPFRIEVEFESGGSAGEINISCVVYNLHGVCVFNAISPPDRYPPGMFRASVRIPGDLLNEGVYRLRVVLAVDFVIRIDIDQVLTFEVHDTQRDIPWYGHWLGVVRPRLAWRFEPLDRPQAAGSSGRQ